jgi:uncharacterized membrane protein YbhN (UPF0104 family)
LNYTLSIIRKILISPIIKNLLIFFFITFFIIFLILNIDFIELQNIWVNANLCYFYFTFPVYLFLSIFAGYMWTILAKNFGINISNNIQIRTYLLTLAARRLPGSFLHIIGRITIYKKLGINAKTLSFISILEIVFIIWSGIIVTILSSIFFFNLEDNLNQLLLILLLLLTILLNPKLLKIIFSKVNDQNLIVINLKYINILSWLLSYIFIWIFGGIMLFLIVLAFTNKVLPENLFLIISGWAISGITGMIITFLPSGLGITELTLVMILRQFLPSTIAISIAFASRILQTLFDLIISGTFLIYEKYINPKGLLK